MNNNSYTQSKRKNPNNTGSLWCAKNVDDWGHTTHFEYYKEDPQVSLGDAFFKLLGILLCIGLFVGGVISIVSSGTHLGLLAIPFFLIVNFVVNTLSKGKEEEE